jgi:hypothetical protein
MRKLWALLLILSIAAVQVVASSSPALAIAAGISAQEEPWQISFTSEQLENLVAPVALYPDPLLAQVLLAATFPDQIDKAARALRAYPRYNVDSQDWDVSVKAVAHYPAVLTMMADKIDWSTSLGQAFVNQSSDVMEAIQHLRRQARFAGNLVTTPQQEIVETDGYIYIYPGQPQYIYVPAYDPAVIFFPHPRPFSGPVIWFSIGFAIGAWLNHDCDWHHHRVFYHGWERGPVWVVRSRPYIRLNNIYVNTRYQNVIVNRTVVNHRVNYGALDRYHAIHRNTDFSNVRREHGVADDRRDASVPARPLPDNKIIRRNIDPKDPRIDANRGHAPTPERPPETRREVFRSDTRTPPTSEAPRAAQGPRSPDSVFRGNRGGIDDRDASRRGQASREHEYLSAGPPGKSGQQRAQGPQSRSQNVPPGQSGKSGQAHQRRPR